MIKHNYEVSVSREAACEASGELVAKCSICGDEQTEEIEAIGHSKDNGTIEKKPGFFTKGLMTYKCKNCNIIMDQEIINGKYPIYYLILAGLAALIILAAFLIIKLCKKKNDSYHLLEI